MKKEFSIWLNIATICLCVCAIAIGVYAAQSATLKVSGSIGFEAHNVEYTATAKAKNYATDEEGEDFKSELTNVTATQGTQSNNELSLTAMYFSDKSGEVPPIELEITITNSSKFDITITPDSATHANDNVSITSPSATSATKSGGTATLKYTLTLNKDSSTGDYKNITTDKALTIKIKLEKKVVAYKKDTNGNQIVVNKYDEPDITTIRANTVTYSNTNYGTSYSDDDKSYAEYFPYYITMGKSSTSATKEDIKWLIVGTNNNGTVTALTTEDKAILETGKMLADTIYVALSAEALYTKDTTNYGISFQNSYTNSGSYLNTAGKNANDYATSNIRAYLNNSSEVYREASSSNGVYSPKTSDGALTPFESMYSLSSSNLYSSIQARSLAQLYNDNGSVTGTFSTDLIDSDKFWLLSKAEVDTLFKDNITNTYYASASITTVQGVTNGSPCWWWLRSPYSDSSNNARGVYNDGCVVDLSGVTYAGGAVRAAFQF